MRKDFGYKVLLRPKYVDWFHSIAKINRRETPGQPVAQRRGARCVWWAWRRCCTGAVGTPGGLRHLRQRPVPRRRGLARPRRRHPTVPRGR